MGKQWDKDKGGRDPWILWMTTLMRECLRVLKPGAHGFVWALPRTSHWTATALEDAGFDIRDVVCHLFGSGFPKSQNISKAIDRAAGAEREVVGQYKSPEASTRKTTISSDSNYRPGQKEIRVADALITAPSTPLAQQWDGWGTAAKPAWEAWLLVAKPFTTVPIDAMLADIRINLQELLCQLFNAKFVQTNSTLNQNASRMDARSDFVQWTVDVSNILSRQEKSDTTAMFKSPEAESIAWSIFLSWNNILDVLLKRENKCITKMGKEVTTELKILSLLISQSMPHTTTKDAIIQNGNTLNVTNADMGFKSASLRLNALSTISAQESVSGNQTHLERHHQEQLEKEYVTTMGVLSENIILVRKPLSEKTIAKNVEKWGVGGINIDGCRVEVDWNTDPNRRGWQGGSNGPGNFSGDRTGVNGKKPTPSKGRFPANLIVSGEEARDLLDEQSGVLVGAGNKDKAKRFGNKKTTSNHVFGRGLGLSESAVGGDSGGASRFFYCAKASKAERNLGCEGMEEKEKRTLNDFGDQSKHNCSDGAKRTQGTGVSKNQNHHPTVKPQKLMRYLARMITPPGGTILDPFMGSGSTGVAALSEGFKFIGIEKEEDYFKIAQARLGRAIKK